MPALSAGVAVVMASMPADCMHFACEAAMQAPEHVHACCTPGRALTPLSCRSACLHAGHAAMFCDPHVGVAILACMHCA